MESTTSRNTRKEVFPSLNKDFDSLKSFTSFEVDDVSSMKKKVLNFSRGFECVCILDNNYPNAHNQHEYIAGFGASQELVKSEKGDSFDSLKNFCDANAESWKFGFLSYDLKNEIEDITSSNSDKIGLPIIHFFIPEILLFLSEGRLYIKSNGVNEKHIYQDIISVQENNSTLGSKEFENLSLESRPEKDEYLEIIKRLKEEIHQGNIYEINYCRELSGRIQIDPYLSFSVLNELSPAPLSTFYKLGDKYLLCSSPERFIKKSGVELISQPIKGTRKRSKDLDEDRMLREQLFSDEKERAENVMIVDLVRNDLSRSASKGSVEVSELFGIYSFPHVHQMISTVRSELKSGIHFTDAIRYCFPMGSMTGAPKLRAMNLIEEYETFKRGLFSGSVGLISPSGNFDFNVVIRSILYNKSYGVISIPTGSAITDMCNAEDEWNECELKAKALLSCLRK